MSIHPKGKGKWEVRWREGTRNRSRTVDRKGDALRLDAEVRRTRQLGGTIPARTGGQTFHDFAREWLADRHNLSPATLELYAGLLDTHVIKEIGHVPVNELRPAALEDWQRRRMIAGAGKSSIAKTIAILRQMLDKAVARELLASNPAAGLELPKTDKRIPTPATPEQVEAMRAYFLERKDPMIGDATLISILGYAGLRPGEALALRWADIEQGTISVTKALSMGTEKGTKTGATRIARPPRQVGQDIAAWKLATPAPFDLIFPRRSDGEPWSRWDWNNWRRRRFTPAAEAAGLEDFRPYDLRHSRASMLAAEGKPITEAAYEMGHSATMFLSTYAHLIEQARDRESVSAEGWIAEARSGLREATG